MEKLKNRIRQIRGADKKSIYELSLEIGISEHTLNNFLYGQSSKETQEKIREFLEDYKTKDEQIAELKAELHSKTEFIQEQREIIIQYSKEIETYKKCQGKRASKREEELKAENERLKRDKIGLHSEIKQLEQENARLKEENKTLEQFLSKEPLALQALQKGYASYKKSTDVFYEMVKEYKQTLQEIRTIAEELSCKHPEECFENKPDWNGEVYGCNVADNWKNPSELATCPSKLASAILQIITKAESEG